MNAPFRSRRRASRPLSDATPPDEAARLALAELALSLAQQGGADYADIRLGATLQDIFARATKAARDGLERRELGLWPARAAARLLGLLRRDVASRRKPSAAPWRRRSPMRARSSPFRARRSSSRRCPSSRTAGRWRWGSTPSACRSAKKADLLLAANAAARDAGADFCTVAIPVGARGTALRQQPRRAHLAEPHAGLARVPDHRRRQGERAFRLARQPHPAARRGLGLCRVLRSSSTMRGAAPKEARQKLRPSPSRPESAISSSIRAICF